MENTRVSGCPHWRHWITPQPPETELLRLKKWYYGREADLLTSEQDVAQILRDFGTQLESRPVDVNDLPADGDLPSVEPKTARRVSRGRLPQRIITGTVCSDLRARTDLSEPRTGHRWASVGPFRRGLQDEPAQGGTTNVHEPLRCGSEKSAFQEYS